MRKIQLILVLSVCMIGFASMGAAETKLIIATGELPPYVSKRPEESFLTDMLQEVAKEMGVAFEFIFLPWKRCELAVEMMEAWGAIPYSPTPKRKEMFDFSEPLFKKQTKFFAHSPDGKQKNINYSELSDLKGSLIGAVRGYYYEHQFLEAGLQVEFVKTEEQNFKKLQSGRVDLIPANDILGWYLIRKLFSAEEKKNFFTLEKPFQVGLSYLITSKKYPDGHNLLAKFNVALKTIKDNGVFQRIIEKHGLDLTY